MDFQCQICFKYGHTAAVCCHRFDQNFAPDQSNSQPFNPFDPPQDYLPYFQQPFEFDFETTQSPFQNQSDQSSRPPPFLNPSIQPPHRNLFRRSDEQISNIRSQTDVALIIAKRLFLKDLSEEKNIVFSPLSLHVVLSILAAGSDGPTLDELLAFLGSNSTDALNSFASQLVSTVLSDASSPGGPRICFANSVLVEQSLPLRHSFKQLMNTDYKANLASVDFRSKALEVANEINLWAETKTNGLIKDLLPPESVGSLTRLIFANALYFKGAWNQKFNASMTRDNEFHLLNGTSVKVPFMVSRKKQFISVFDGFKVLRLLYNKCELSMYLFLPDETNGLSALVERVTSTPEFLERSIPHKEVEVGDFRIPKFKISFKFEASDLLKELGVVLPFSPSAADLTKMVDSPEGRDLYVSKIFHKSCIEVNEEGTEAAAATCMIAFSMGGARVRTPQVDFIADHPFLFVIREDITGTTLFTGQVLNPLAG